SGRRARRHRPNTGSRRFQRILPSISSLTPPSCAGALSATIMNSNRRLASGTLKGRVGAASTITQHCASRPMDSWSPSGRRFPPRKLVPLGSSKRLQFPKLVARGVPPLRPERHVPNSIATVRRRLSVALVATLSRCPCCVEPISAQGRHRKLRRSRIPLRLRGGGQPHPYGRLAVQFDRRFETALRQIAPTAPASRSD